MKILDVVINCKSRSDRVEIFPFYDMHVGKANCNERAIRKQVQEIVKRGKLPNRHVRVLLGGDAVNAVSPSDRKRFDFSDVADWLISGSKEEIKNALADMPRREIKRAYKLLLPIKNSIIGALEGNHEKSLRKYHNIDVQASLCERLDCENMSDESLLRFQFRRNGGKNTATSMIYLRHGYGSGRSESAELLKLSAMRAEWEIADVCLSGHTHTFCNAPPKAVSAIPLRGALPVKLLWQHRFAANPGCWLDSHTIGRGTYESNSCYPARAFMTCKIVIWPFFKQWQDGQEFNTPKIEIRSYPIL